MQLTLLPHSGSGASASFAADGSSAKVNIYMTILLIAIAVLAFIKTVGATICELCFEPQWSKTLMKTLFIHIRVCCIALYVLSTDMVSYSTYTKSFLRC